MANALRFHRQSGIACLCFFLIEILILKTSGFIRHTLGDYLAVMLLYYLVKTFFEIKPVTLGIALLLFSFAIEFLQLANLIDVLGLSENYTAKIILGNTFSISDLVAYTLGILTVVWIDINYRKN